MNSTKTFDKLESELEQLKNYIFRLESQNRALETENSNLKARIAYLKAKYRALKDNQECSAVKCMAEPNSTEVQFQAEPISTEPQEYSAEIGELLLSDIMGQERFFVLSEDAKQISRYHALFTRAVNRLRWYNFNKLKDLNNVSTKQLFKISAIGIKTIAFIIIVCDQYSLEIQIDDYKRKEIYAAMASLKEEIVF